MKIIKITLALIVIFLATGCQKDDINTSRPKPLEETLNCNRCQGGWDLTDTIP